MNRQGMFGTAVIFIVALAIGLASPGAFADDKESWFAKKGREHRQEHREKEHRKWMEKMNLTKEQKAQVENIHAEQGEKMKARMEQVRAERTKMIELMGKDASEADLRAQHEKVLALRTEMGREWFETALKVHALLTPEQRKKMAEMGSAMHGHGMMQGHGSPGCAGCPMDGGPEQE